MPSAISRNPQKTGTFHLTLRHSPLLPRPKPRWRRGAKRLDGADVRCERSSRIFCKIHYRAFASPTAPKNGIGRCTLTEVLQRLQHRSIAQCDWNHYSGRLPLRAQRGDRKRTRQKAGSGSQVASRETICLETSCLAA